MTQSDSTNEAEICYCADCMEKRAAHPKLCKGGYWPSDEALDPANDSTSPFSQLGIEWCERLFNAPSRGELDAIADNIAASAALL